MPRRQKTQLFPGMPGYEEQRKAALGRELLQTALAGGTVVPEPAAKTEEPPRAVMAIQLVSISSDVLAELPAPSLDELVWDFKARIATFVGAPPDRQQLLTCDFIVLDDKKTLAENGLRESILSANSCEGPPVRLTVALKTVPMTFVPRRPEGNSEDEDGGSVQEERREDLACEWQLSALDGGAEPKEKHLFDLSSSVGACNHDSALGPPRRVASRPLHHNANGANSLASAAESSRSWPQPLAPCMEGAEERQLDALPEVPSQPSEPAQPPEVSPAPRLEAVDDPRHIGAGRCVDVQEQYECHNNHAEPANSTGELRDMHEAVEGNGHQNVEIDPFKSHAEYLQDGEELDVEGEEEEEEDIEEECDYAEGRGREIGIVKTYETGKGFGFIYDADKEKLLVHQSQIITHGFCRLEAGQQVSFIRGENDGKQWAEDVRNPDGSPICFDKAQDEAAASAARALGVVQAMAQDYAVMQRNLRDYDAALQATIAEAHRLRSEVSHMERACGHVADLRELIAQELRSHAELHRLNAELSTRNEELESLIHSSLDVDGDVQCEACLEALMMQNDMLWQLVRFSNVASHTALSSLHSGPMLRSPSDRPSLGGRTRSLSGSTPSRRSELQDTPPLERSPLLAGSRVANSPTNSSSPYRDVAFSQDSPPPIPPPPLSVTGAGSAALAAAAEGCASRDADPNKGSLAAGLDSPIASLADHVDTFGTDACNENRAVADSDCVPEVAGSGFERALDEDDISEVSSLVETAIFLGPQDGPAAAVAAAVSLQDSGTGTSTVPASPDSASALAAEWS